MVNMKVDDVYELVGPLGRYQLLQISLSSLGSFACSLHVIIAIFHSLTPDFRCKIPSMDNDGYYVNNSLANWIPRDFQAGVYDSCLLYDHSSINYTEDSHSNKSGQIPTAKCNEFVFSKQLHQGRTLAEEFSLVCDRRGLSTVAKVSFTSGMIVGAPLAGFLADIFGRRWVMIALMLVGATFGTIATFSYNLLMYSTLRFGIAASLIGLAGLANCIAMEITGPRKRPLAITFRWAFWPVAQMCVSLLAYYIQDWHWLQLTCSLPIFVFAGLQILYLKETPHFLMMKNRTDEAVGVFKDMARMNGRSMHTSLEEDKNSVEQPDKRERLIAIIRAPTLLKRTAVFLFLWFIAGLGHVGLNFHVTYLTGSVYLNNVFSGFAELLVCVLIYLSHYLGRKIPVISTLLLGSLSLISVSIMNVYLNLDEYSTALIVVTMIGKLSVSGVMAFDYFWSNEMFPSVLRGSLGGICNMFARFGSLLAPVIVDLYLYLETPFHEGLGPLIVGLIMVVGSATAIYLPETNNQKLPETLHQANVFMVKSSEHVEKNENRNLWRRTNEGEVNNAYNASSLNEEHNMELSTCQQPA